MKKLFIVILLCLFCIPISAQTTFPYSKFLSYTDEQLAEARFKYDNNKNQWVLAKGFTPDKTEAKRLAKLFPNQTPSEDNYRITIQNGANGVAFIDVLFYKDATFHVCQRIWKEPPRNEPARPTKIPVRLRGFLDRTECLHARSKSDHTQQYNHYQNAGHVLQYL